LVIKLFVIGGKVWINNIYTGSNIFSGSKDTTILEFEY